ncbi:MAG TPA: hypothetical protein VFE25_05290 [Opitutaceae bacterium]|nr:hypothetical protein [Opitutaceae bacterium]
MKARTWIFFWAAALLLYLRLEYRALYFPIYFEGEEAKVLDLAKATCDYAAYSHSAWVAFVGGIAEYNKGYAYFLIPFYRHFGYDVRLITYILPVFFSLFCATLFTIYRKAYPKSSLLSFLLVAFFSVLCLSLRRYKWHSVMYPAALSIYFYFLPQFQTGISAVRARCLKVLAALVWVFSCYLYFGCFIYFFPFLILLHFFNNRAQRRRAAVVTCVGLVLFALSFSAACYYDAVWRERIKEEFQYILADFSFHGLQQRWWATRDFFFTLDLSTPYLLLFTVGAVATYHRIRRGDRFALINGTILACLWAFELLIQGLNNADQLNWSMIPLLGVLLMGADEFLIPLRERVRGGAVIGLFVALLVVSNELDHYVIINRETPYQPGVQPRNIMTQAALVLMLIRDDDSGAAQYYLPDPSVPQTRGGFDYNVSLMRVDFQRALSKVTFYTSEEDLRAKLARQPITKRAVAYLSVGEIPGGDNPVDQATVGLLGEQPAIIHPYASIYGIEYLVRRFSLHPGAPAPARS